MIKHRFPTAMLNSMPQSSVTVVIGIRQRKQNIYFTKQPNKNVE